MMKKLNHREPPGVRRRGVRGLEAGAKRGGGEIGEEIATAL